MAVKADDPYATERESLRNHYEDVRAKAQPVAEAIARDLPDFTVHDITHSDALWDLADMIAGPSYPLNPCECFVLGCAFLIHDLGMGLAAYPEGLSGLKRGIFWKDAVAEQLRLAKVDDITEASIANADAQIERMALREALRLLHAERAEALATMHWDSPSGDQRFYLIENSNLRASFGPLIGRIAYSHWWSVDRLFKEFPFVTGAQSGFPQTWTVDPLKLACLLRCADYTNIDDRRAPSFLRALRKPMGDSDNHWRFQENLYQPRLEGDRIVFTAKRAFTLDEASAWWLCYDTLNAIDSELKRVDALLADNRRQRFVARAVSHVEEPSRLAELIRTEGWKPVDTRIRVSAVAELVAKLGGRELYGNDTSPPLREMIQNAADAVRARRALDGSEKVWGEIRICLGNDESGQWIQVEDTGVGMSEAILTGPLLDFGTSFWNSPLMHEELPGLASKGFKSAGQYGIGFFSVFMWGDHVEIASQRFDKGRQDSLVLSFVNGLNGRPLLRKANPAEYIQDGGTRVKIWFKDPSIVKRLFWEDHHGRVTLERLVASIAPCLDVTIKTSEAPEPLRVAVKANDWLSIRDEELLDRLVPINAVSDATLANRRFCPPLALLKDSNGRVHGRAAIWNNHDEVADYWGSVIAGGFDTDALSGIIGVLNGEISNAARDAGIPSVDSSVLVEWANNQASCRLKEAHAHELLEQQAQLLRLFGVDIGQFPLCFRNSQWFTAKQLSEVVKESKEVILVDLSVLEFVGRYKGELRLYDSVFAVTTHSGDAMLDPDAPTWPPDSMVDRVFEYPIDNKSIEAFVIQVIADSWNVPLKEVIDASFPEYGDFIDDSDDEMREIGVVDGRPFMDKVNVIRRPL